MKRLLTLLPLALAAAVAMPAMAAPMNVLVIMTDDQRWDTVGWMPNLTALASQGVTFNNAFAITPLCAPNRSMLFSGGYLPQNTGVMENALPDGGATLFNDHDNLGVMLQTAGYRTGFVGKWINGYEGMGNYVPPGWSRWVGRHSFATNTSWSSFRYVTGASNQNSSTGTISTANQYTTDFERDQILSFLNSTPAAQPFFVVWTPSAPHERATPEAQDATLFSNYVYQSPGTMETDLSDKPKWVRTKDKPISNEFVRDQLRSLQSVDRAIADLVSRLKALGRFNNTLIVFSSDNGYLWGEHTLSGKNADYEESIRVPFVVLMPGVTPRSDDSLVLPSLDLGPTFFELAGISKSTDGRSLVPLLQGSGPPWRTEIFIEANASNAGQNAIWAGLRDNRWKYVRYWDGTEELYDLVNDPYELSSQHKNASLSSLKTAMWSRIQPQLGLAIIPTRGFPSCQVGVSYKYQFKIWGGEAPFTWKLESGKLPPGLSLGGSSGLLQGVPTAAGTYNFAVRLTDSSLATHTGKPRTYATRSLKLVVKT